VPIWSIAKWKSSPGNQDTFFDELKARNNNPAMGGSKKFLRLCGIYIPARFMIAAAVWYSNGFRASISIAVVGAVRFRTLCNKDTRYIGGNVYNALDESPARDHAGAWKGT
jgi:hypothetical protein